MKRELGEGRWDRILKRRLLELSVSDNYDEAKHEWIATGNVRGVLGQLMWGNCKACHSKYRVEH